MLQKRPRPFFIKIIREAYYCVYNPAKRLYYYLFTPEVPGVKTFVVHDERLLLVRIGYAHKCWTLPGGKIDKGEVPIVAAAREVFEESGAVLVSSKFLTKITYHQENKIIDLYYFYGEVDSDDLVIDYQEIIDAGWFAFDNLPENITPKLQQEIQIIKDHLAKSV